MPGKLADISKKNGLLWDKNSCYMDSVLFSLLYQNTPFVKDRLLKPIAIHRQENNSIVYNKNNDNMPQLLKNVYLIINTGEKSISNTHIFRNKLKNYTQLNGVTFPKFYQNDTQDASEFLKFIFSELTKNDKIKIHPVNCMIKLEQKLYTNETDNSLFNLKMSNDTNRKKIYEENILKKDIPIYDILPNTSPFIVPKYGIKGTDIQTILDFGEYIDNNHVNVNHKGQNFKRVVYRTSLLKTPYLIITLPRMTMTEPTFDIIKKKQKITPNQYIKISDCKLYLNSIIVHIGNENKGHYICFFHYNNKWYLYDDIQFLFKPTFKEIGTYKDLLNYPQSDKKDTVNPFFSIEQNATIFIYTKKIKSKNKKK